MSFKVKEEYLLNNVLTISILSEWLFMTLPNLRESDLSGEKITYN